MTRPPTFKLIEYRWIKVNSRDLSGFTFSDPSKSYRSGSWAALALKKVGNTWQSMVPSKEIPVIYNMIPK